MINPRSYGRAFFTSVHEAGHGVSASYLRIRFKYVTIIPSGDMEGHIWCCGGPRFRPLTKLRGEFKWVTADWKPKYRKYYENYVVMQLAGAAATRLLCDSEYGSEIDTYLAAARRKADEIVRIPYIREAINELAEDLFVRKTIRSGEVRRTLFLMRRYDTSLNRYGKRKAAA